MVCVTVMYPTEGGTKLDWDYYLGAHVQLGWRLLGPRGMRRLEIGRAVGAFPPGSPPLYHAIANLYFDSMEQVQAALAETAAQFEQDKEKYFTGESVLQFSETIETRAT